MESNRYPQSGYTFLGLMSLADPPKATVPGAIADVRGAGVKVVMVTGDHPVTAAAIARQVGIITQPTKAQLALEQQVNESDVSDEMVQAVVVTGPQLNTFEQADWDRVLSKPEVLAGVVCHQPDGVRWSGICDSATREYLYWISHAQLCLIGLC